jgi:hypothetical protein
MQPTTAFPGIPGKGTAFGIEVQEALFNSITAKPDKLLVAVPDWRTTDSLLKAAGLDFRKVAYMDKEQLARLLKVDAILSGRVLATSSKSLAAPALGRRHPLDAAL